ncbi:hypothetical protein [Gordonia iterans]
MDTLAPPTPTRTFTDDLRWACNAWRSIPGLLTGAAAIWLVVLAATALIAIGLTATAGFALWTFGMPDTIATPAVVGTLAVPPFFATWLAATCWLRSVVAVADGRSLRLVDFFRPVEVETLLAVSIVQWAGIVALAFNAGRPASGWIAAGLAIVGLLTMWTGFIAYERQCGVLAALRASAALVFARPAGTVLVFGVGLIAHAAGAALFGVGLVGTVPFSGLLAVAVFRTLTGGPLAPPGGPDNR